ncbi:hypothetical protein ACFQH3_16215 [Haladaptatus sp. GCM10025707]|uniref:hypothetical protein n=1 Tax=Haladaptatus sp. GCM10025707 TaxID=3252658 RepID=UPI00361EE45A
MAHAENAELIERFEEFYRNYYRDAIGELAQKYPNEQRSLYIDYQDLYRFDPDLADDYKSQPGQLQQYAEEALRMYDLPVDVGLAGRTSGSRTCRRRRTSGRFGHDTAADSSRCRASSARPPTFDRRFRKPPSNACAVAR